MRVRKALWPAAVIVAWAGALAGLGAIDPEVGTEVIVSAALLTVVAGALLDRWWATFVPLGVASAAIAIDALVGPECSDCSDEVPLLAFYLIAVVAFCTPAGAAMALGVGLRKLSSRRSVAP